MGKHSAEIFPQSDVRFQGNREIRFLLGGGFENDFRKMSADGRNVKVFREIPQFGAMYLVTSSAHANTVRSAARETGLTRNANTV